MKERPILFSAPMVRALLDGSKTQTRRVCKAAVSGDGTEYRDAHGWPLRYDESSDSDFSASCPYGQRGDRLWVKETHWRDDEDGEILYAANPDDLALVNLNKSDSGSARYNWKPSIFMRREYSRITLEVTGVSVERLQDINEADAMAEGAAPILVPPDGGSWPHVEGYQALWESINGPGSWAANPWVWVIEFKRAGK